ncbi:unnamed protein product [Rhizoctonia solani]|uniref:F-box domain-containing protein n=1 Tax=Rhizoctonia solani TaxID=456999 RepID=A0A8H3DWY7_9AGAM|nr:unnamed protein product [Rhizoctonia solani]
MSFNGRLPRINRLSPQILSRIFILCDQLWYADSKESKSPAPFGCQLIIPAVCHTWRKIALDMTTFWTRVRLADRAPFRLFELFLTRSGDVAPLDIDMNMTGSFWKTDDEFQMGTADEVDEALNFIVEHGGSLTRWRSVHIEVDTFHAFYRLCPFFGNVLPALKSLELA